VVTAEVWEAWSVNFTQRAVEATEGYGVGELEEVMVELWGRVHAHRHEADKHRLWLELEGLLKREAVPPAAQAR
jgi:hypothetical protein